MKKNQITKFKQLGKKFLESVLSRIQFAYTHKVLHKSLPKIFHGILDSGPEEVGELLCPKG